MFTQKRVATDPCERGATEALKAMNPRKFKSNKEEMTPSSNKMIMCTIIIMLYVTAEIYHINSRVS